MRLHRITYMVIIIDTISEFQFGSLIPLTAYHEYIAKWIGMNLDLIYRYYMA